MKGAGIPAAPGPALNPRAGLEAFARVVVDEAPARVVARIVERLGELETEARSEAADRKRSADARQQADIRARTYARAARALELAAREASS